MLNFKFVCKYIHDVVNNERTGAPERSVIFHSVVSEGDMEFPSGAFSVALPASVAGALVVGSAYTSEFVKLPPAK